MNKECCDPHAPVKKCLNCGESVYTCEKEHSDNNDYRCPIHKEGVETKHGWFCNDKCYFEYDPL